MVLDDESFHGFPLGALNAQTYSLVPKRRTYPKLDLKGLLGTKKILNEVYKVSDFCFP